MSLLPKKLSFSRTKEAISKTDTWIGGWIKEFDRWYNKFIDWSLNITTKTLKVGISPNITEIDKDGNIKPQGNAFLIFQKASGNGIKVDQAIPTYGFADMLGKIESRNTGASKPSFEQYNGEIDRHRFSAGDKESVTYHVPHDYVKGTDLFLHVHWSQISTTNTGGTITFEYFIIYAKGHAQAAFTSAPLTATFVSDGAGSEQYFHQLTEIQVSAASPSASQMNTADIEPDTIIELAIKVNANNLTDSSSVTDPFIHEADLHYQTTGLIGTKQKAPNFYV